MPDDARPDDAMPDDAVPDDAVPAAVPDDDVLPRLNVHDATFTPMPEFGGSQAVLYRSADGRRLAGSFRESGRHTLTMEYDEFIYVVAGRMTVTVNGGQRQEFTAGDACYLQEGMTVDFEMDDGFQDVAVLVSDNAIPY